MLSIWYNPNSDNFYVTRHFVVHNVGYRNSYGHFVVTILLKLDNGDFSSVPDYEKYRYSRYLDRWDKAYEKSLKRIRRKNFLKRFLLRIFPFLR